MWQFTHKPFLNSRHHLIDRAWFNVSANTV